MLRQKEIKQMQIDALEDTFREVRDMVIMSPTGIDVTTENSIRLDLRNKDIRLMLVKNSFMRRVFGKLGMDVNDCWTGPTVLAWGGSSLAALSKELDTIFKKDKRVEFKGAICDGEQLTFKEALEMPTKEEAIGRVISLALSPAANIVSQIKGPASSVAGQIKSKGEEEESAETAA